MPYLNVNRFLAQTRAEGPGLRCCFWLQGCMRHCPGCCNEPMQSFEKKTILTSEEAISLVRQAVDLYGIQGVTFLGGEPLLQTQGLLPVLSWIRSQGLTTMLFTGYLFEECQKDVVPGTSELLQFIDVLVDGPFLEDQLDEVRNWVGSRNQRFIYLTNRYDKRIETDMSFKGIVEVYANADTCSLNGCPKTLSSFNNNAQSKLSKQEKRNTILE